MLFRTLAVAGLAAMVAAALPAGAQAYDPYAAFVAPVPVPVWTPTPLPLLTPSAGGNPCAPYAWCGPRDAWGRAAYPSGCSWGCAETGGWGAAIAILQGGGHAAQAPRVNGWTGRVETEPHIPGGILVMH